MDDIEDLGTKDRIAIVDPNKCKPDKCGKQCIKICPVNRQGKICIELDTIPSTLESEGKGRKIASITESMCTGCGLCVKMCPFSAIKIVNIPKGLRKDIVHRYGSNSFKLHKLPNIKAGQITGILGQNGLGKSTIMNIFERNILMNLGNFDTNVDYSNAVLKRFRGTDIQKIIAGKITTCLKPQNINELRQDMTVREYLKVSNIENDHVYRHVVNLLDRSMLNISGGELQRVIILKVCEEKADLMMFDEPTSFLDLGQRIRMADRIRDLTNDSKKYVMVVDHDINILDYISDQLVILYGERGAYGICATPLPINQGINAYFDGYLQKDNVRFRKYPFSFETSCAVDTRIEQSFPIFSHPIIDWSIGDFTLRVEAADYYNHSITALLGENGSGKTTFVNIIAQMSEKNKMTVSVKNQYIDRIDRSDAKRTVTAFLGDAIHVLPYSDMVKKLDIDSIAENKLRSLSGGELQKVMIMKCIMVPADIYLFDEPSAFLDTETRVIVSKMIKDYFFDKPVSVFIIDHDMLMTTFLADQSILFEGITGSRIQASSPIPIKEGMNRYLKNIGITMRTDQSSRRRLNKLNSAKDQEQKKNDEYY